MKLTTARKWRKTLAWLRRNFPATSAVRVQSVPMTGFHGYARRKTRYFQIKINSKKSFALKIDTLIHEWAHILTWFGAETHIEDHSAEWGIAYAKIYRTYLEWNYGREEKSDADTI